MTLIGYGCSSFHNFNVKAFWPSVSCSIEGLNGHLTGQWDLSGGWISLFICPIDVKQTALLCDIALHPIPSTAQFRNHSKPRSAEVVEQDRVPCCGACNVMIHMILLKMSPQFLFSHMPQRHREPSRWDMSDHVTHRRPWNGSLSCTCCTENSFSDVAWCTFHISMATLRNFMDRVFL